MNDVLWKDRTHDAVWYTVAQHLQSTAVMEGQAVEWKPAQGCPRPRPYHLYIADFVCSTLSLTLIMRYFPISDLLQPCT